MAPLMLPIIGSLIVNVMVFCQWGGICAPNYHQLQCRKKPSFEQLVEQNVRAARPLNMLTFMCCAAALIHPVPGHPYPDVLTFLQHEDSVRHLQLISSHLHLSKWRSSPGSGKGSKLADWMCYDSVCIHVNALLGISGWFWSRNLNDW